MGIRREPAGSQIAAELRLDILFGRLAPGTIVSQEAMCERFSISRMPVRDAFQQLVHEGFLERFSGNRLRVIRLNREDLLDMFWLEATVHALATKRATQRHVGDPVSFATLRRMQAEMLDCAKSGDVATASRINRSFHRSINHLAGSPRLISTLKTVSMGIQGVFIQEVPEWLSRSIREHEDILRAMEHGDADQAEQLMFVHIQGSAIKIADDLLHLSAGVLTGDGLPGRNEVEVLGDVAALDRE